MVQQCPSSGRLGRPPASLGDWERALIEVNGFSLGGLSIGKRVIVHNRMRAYVTGEHVPSPKPPSRCHFRGSLKPIGCRFAQGLFDPEVLH